MGSPWAQEALRLVVLLVLGVFLGGLAGNVLLGSLIAALVFSGYQLLQMHRFAKWSASKKKVVLNQKGGWGELSYEYLKLQKKSRARKKKLGKILKRFRESTHALPDPAVLLNSRDEIEWFNKAAELMLGLNYKDRGQIVSNIIRAPKFAGLLQNNKGNASLEIRSPVDDAKSLELRLVEFKNQRLLVARDTTHIHHLMNMRQQFVANVSHELRTPLTVVLGYLEILSDDESLGKEYRERIDKMLKPATRMKTIVGDLLTLSTLDTAEPPLLDKCPEVKVSGLLNSLMIDMELLNSGRHAIKVDIQSNLMLRAVDSELYSVFSNLISNAIKYTPDGTQISVRWYEANGKAIFEVHDTGQGIEQEHLPRLTERFYRIDVGRSRDKGGTGLGLAIVKQILRRHDSELEISSEVGQGSCFSCEFPSPRVVFSTSSD
ncbi:MAG: phosphate regulon sensor histidine kinase PhoR [Gammaproteobacteria bacterium]|nr:phosphate regulon sensor histidine kinase PhoR [Gammaproteobacteria bacterium]